MLTKIEWLFDNYLLHIGFDGALSIANQSLAATELQELLQSAYDHNGPDAVHVLVDVTGVERTTTNPADLAALYASVSQQPNLGTVLFYGTACCGVALLVEALRVQNGVEARAFTSFSDALAYLFPHDIALHHTLALATQRPATVASAA